MSEIARPSPATQADVLAKVPRAWVEILGSAWCGTVIAGGFYPLFVGFVLWALAGFPFSMELFEWFIPPIAGLYYAGFVAVPIVFMVRGLCAAFGINRPTLSVAPWVGGWTGFVCTYWLMGLNQLTASEAALMAVAVVFGQIGAAWGARQMFVSYRRARPALDPTQQRMRFGLRQLLGLTTATCIAGALAGEVVGGLQLFAAVLLCGLFQLTTVMGARLVVSMRPGPGS